jgi:hypothetical protein
MICNNTKNVWQCLPLRLALQQCRHTLTTADPEGPSPAMVLCQTPHLPCCKKSVQRLPLYTYCRLLERWHRWLGTLAQMQQKMPCSMGNALNKCS